ncbi:MAG: membrane protein of unknown function [Promethearchaeota archaeon]|nr:MAG: membrane protein of unknown function [Candidatus Lokiarchaeota archaeon]
MCKKLYINFNEYIFIMNNKKVLRIFLLCFILSISIILIQIFNNLTDSWMNQYKFYSLPFGENAGQQAVFFYLLAIITPYISILMGYGLAYLIVRIYCRFSKYSKRIEFIGYANIDRSGKYLRRRYLIQILFAVLLCTNIWILLVGDDMLMRLWLTNEGQSEMLGNQGEYRNFVFIPWYWVPLVITTLVFSTSVVIMDSGLVSIKKLHGHSEFSDTERVGDRIFGIIKGYAGISVIISFIILIQSPKGNELSLVLYPISALFMILPFIIAIDLFRNIGKKWIFKATKPYYVPQLVKLSFEKEEITDFRDLLDQ